MPHGCYLTRHWMRHYLSGLALALAGVLILAACGGPQRQPVPHGQAITVRGRVLLRGGVAFVPRGVQIVGIVAPDTALRGIYLEAHQHFGLAQLRKAMAYHVNTIRFQVSQYGLDPQDPLYSPAYVQEVVDAVRMARGLGLAVIVSVQTEGPAGQANRCPLPDAGTVRVWDKLASIFRTDRGVMFELFNEPAVPPTASGWALWKGGGSVGTIARSGNSGGLGKSGGSCMAVGMQRLIDAIRARGARNVIIVPAGHKQQTMAGMPSLTDPASPTDPQLAYGIHYPPLTAGWPRWRRDFGAASYRVPVIVTEWNADSKPPCEPAAPTAAPALLNYLASRHIGVVGFAFDVPGTIIRDWSYVPTSYRGFQCGVPGGGPGELLFARFAAQAKYGPA